MQRQAASASEAVVYDTLKLIGTSWGMLEHYSNVVLSMLPEYRFLVIMCTVDDIATLCKLY